MHSNQIEYRLDRIEHFLSGKMTAEDAQDFKQELTVKFMSADEKKEWAEGAEERNAQIAEEKKQKKLAAKKAASVEQKPVEQQPSI